MPKDIKKDKKRLIKRFKKAGYKLSKRDKQMSYIDLISFWCDHPLRNIFK